MTLIVSVATSDAIYQMSDRRITDFNDSNRVVCDDECKAAIVHGLVACAYTGRTPIGPHPSATWIAAIGSRLPENDLELLLPMITAEASRAFGEYRDRPSTERFHTFVAIGWERSHARSDLMPFLYTISNAFDAAGVPQRAPLEMFEGAANRWDSTFDTFAVAYHGQSLTDSAKRTFEQHVRSIIRNSAKSRASFVESMAMCVHGLAAINEAVGPGLTAVCIPKASVIETLRAGGYHLRAGGHPADEEVTYFHMRPDGTQIDMESPAIGCTDGLLRRFRTVRGDVPGA